MFNYLFEQKNFFKNYYGVEFYLDYVIHICDSELAYRSDYLNWIKNYFGESVKHIFTSETLEKEFVNLKDNYVKNKGKNKQEQELRYNFRSLDYLNSLNHNFPNYFPKYQNTYENIDSVSKIKNELELNQQEYEISDIISQIPNVHFAKFCDDYVMFPKEKSGIYKDIEHIKKGANLKNFVGFKET